MDLFGFGINKIIVFFMVFFRVLGIFSTAPIFGNRQITPMIRVCIALVLALTFLPLSKFDASDINLYKLAFIAVKEVLVGLMMGFVASLMFNAVQMAGAFIDMASGLGSAQLVDPMTQQHSTVISNFYMLVATLVFLAINGHHLMIIGLADSFNVLPIGSMNFSPEIAGGLFTVFGKVFLAALKIGAPIVGVVFLTDVALGVLARTVPQLNVFVVGMPAKLGISVITIIVILPVAIGVMTGLFSSIHKDLIALVTHLAY